MGVPRAGLSHSTPPSQTFGRGVHLPRGANRRQAAAARVRRRGLPDPDPERGAGRLPEHPDQYRDQDDETSTRRRGPGPATQRHVPHLGGIVFEGASSSPPWWAMLRKCRSSHRLGSGATALAEPAPRVRETRSRGEKAATNFHGPGRLPRRGIAGAAPAAGHPTAAASRNTPIPSPKYRSNARSGTPRRQLIEDGATRGKQGEPRATAAVSFSGRT